MFRLFTSILILISTLSINAQFYSTGQAPASVKWEQINTSNFQLIFPEGFYKEANRTANALEFLYSKIAEDYTFEPKKISIILHNRSVLSNGYVVWAPKRAEWITTPASESYAHDWLEQLAIHEFRHVVQLNNLEQGFSKVLKYLIGEAAPGAISAYLPLWFLEGDAVYAETAYTSSGRGREPNFNLELRTIELDRNIRFSYDQSYLGSYKYHIPDHYKYGYQMVSYGRLKYGDDLWKKTLNNVARRPFSLAPFYFGLRKSGAHSKVKLYNETFDSLHYHWTNQLEKQAPKSISLYTQATKHYTEYKYVQEIDEGSFAVKSGIDDIAHFVLLSDSSEKILFTPGRYSDSPVDAGKDYICWVESLPDIRWEQRSYSEIKLLNRKTEKLETLERKTRRFFPTLSPDEKSLACVQIDLENNYTISILALPHGEVKQKFLIDQVSSIKNLVWVSDSQLAYVSLNKEGHTIKQLNIITGKSMELFHAGYKNIGQIAFAEKHLFFPLDWESVRNIYALDLETKNVSRVTSVRHGADYPSYSMKNKTLSYSEYSLFGYTPKSISFNKLEFTSIDSLSEYENPWVKEHSRTANFDIQKQDIPQKEYPAEKYQKENNSQNFHSWLPFYADIDHPENIYQDIALGAVIFSQNKLSTLTTSIGYYHKNGTNVFEPKIIFEGLYPKFEFKASFTNVSSGKWPSGVDIPYNLAKSRSISIKSYVPLNLSRNKYHRLIQPSVNYLYYHTYYPSGDKPMLGIAYLGTGLFAYNLLKKSHRDIKPRYGQILQFNYYKPLKNPAHFTPFFHGSLTEYLPGFWKHHAIELKFEIEKNDDEKFPFLSNQLSLPRGDTLSIYYNKLLKGYAEYSLPILYPDWNIGPFAYIKRIHLTAHIDAARINYLSRIDNTLLYIEDAVFSAGLIISPEMHFLRFFIPVIPNFRISYVSRSNSLNFGISASASF